MPSRTTLDKQEVGKDIVTRLDGREPKKRAHRDASESDVALGRGNLEDVELASDYKTSSVAEVCVDYTTDSAN